MDDPIVTHGGDAVTTTTDYDAIRGTETTFLALPTPTPEDGSTDILITEAAAETLESRDGNHVVIIKSTVIPTTTCETLALIIEAAFEKTLVENLHMTVKSEFPREETAVEYFLNPDKAALGTDSGSAHDVFELLVTDVGAAVVDTGVEEIEVITYDDSGFLAAKVSLINDIGNI